MTLSPTKLTIFWGQTKATCAHTHTHTHTHKKKKNSTRTLQEILNVLHCFLECSSPGDYRRTALFKQSCNH
jgi:hypothetical protein